jgi:hypothetical protein
LTKGARRNPSSRVLVMEASPWRTLPVRVPSLPGYRPSRQFRPHLAVVFGPVAAKRLGTHREPMTAELSTQGASQSLDIERYWSSCVASRTQLEDEGEERWSESLGPQAYSRVAARVNAGTRDFRPAENRQSRPLDTTLPLVDFVEQRVGTTSCPFKEPSPWPAPRMAATASASPPSGSPTPS